MQGSGVGTRNRWSLRRRKGRGDDAEQAEEARQWAGGRRWPSDGVGRGRACGGGGDEWADEVGSLSGIKGADSTGEEGVVGDVAALEEEEKGGRGRSRRGSRRQGLEKGAASSPTRGEEAAEDADDVAELGVLVDPYAEKGEDDEEEAAEGAVKQLEMVEVRRREPHERGVEAAGGIGAVAGVAEAGRGGGPRRALP